MRIGKRLIHLAMVILCFAALGIAIATAFGMTWLFWIGWGVFAGALGMWLITFLGIDPVSSGMTPAEEDAAVSSQAKHVGTGAVALILALIFMLCCTVIRGVWYYTEKNDIKFQSISTDTLNATEVNADNLEVTEAEIDTANVDTLNVTEANITKVNATEVNVTKVHATEVNATVVNATEANITKANIDNAHINKAEIKDAYIDNAYIDKGYFGQLSNIISGLGSGGGDKGNIEVPTTVKKEEPTTVKREEPTTVKKEEPTTAKREEPTTEKPTEPTTKKPEPTTVLNPSLKFEADKMSGSVPLMNSASDKVYIIIEDCSISDINYYWCNPDTGLNTKDGISFVKVADGKYKMVVEDWVFENSLDIAIKNPATQNQYYVVKIQPTYE